MSETTTTLSNNLWSFYYKNLLENAKKNLRLVPLAKQVTHPKGMGKVMSMLRYGHVAASTSELTEGVTPSVNTIDTNKYDITIKQYGTYIRFSDLLQTTAIDDVITSATKELGYTAALSMDQIVRNDLYSTATAQNVWAGSATSDNTVTATTTMTAQDVLKGLRYFRVNDAQPMDGGLYTWVVNPGQAIDIISDTAAGGFIELSKYTSPNAENIFNGEVGKLSGCRILESSNISATANASTVNVYYSLLFAKDAFAVTKFDKDAVKLIIKNAGSAGTSDPLDQVATVGYKMQFGTKYLGGDFSGANSASPDLVVQIRSAQTGG